MFEKTIETVVNDLIQLDVDAFYTYSEAIKNITETDIKQKMEEFQKDHERHIKDLSMELKELGGIPIKHNRDLKGFVIEGMTALRSLTGTNGALKAMITNEETTNKKYEDALSYNGFPKELKSLMQSNFNDEKRHLEYVKEKLKELENEKDLA